MEFNGALRGAASAMSAIDDVRPPCNRRARLREWRLFLWAVAADSFLAACIWTGIAWDLQPGATAQEAGEKLGLGHLL
jgi:hypothetical protein